MRVEAEAGGGSGVGEGAVAVVLVERRRVVGEICLENVEVAVAVVVGDRRSHAGLLAPVFVEGRACGHRNIGESSIVIVVVENAGRAVAGDENVGPAVFVEIERGDAEGIVAVGAVDVRFGRNVFKRAVAAIVIENVLRPRQATRPAHHRNALPDAGRTLAGRGRGRQIEVDIVRYDEIEPAVAVVVDEGAARAPGLARSGDAGLSQRLR